MAENLLGGPAPTLLPADHPDVAARAALAAGEDLRAVAARLPAASYAWGMLAREALAAGDPVAAYAYARTGYHRGLDALRRSGWKGHGPIPADHAPNQGFLIALLALADAAEQIGETEEAQRCRTFADDSDPAARSL
ncbi:DUF3151 domain-containing protein [Occultella glacieicola]|uniref:DUF3151 domain-containing protein n=1 Tax=Occultella glacieicola TaxID=2518684 RepID=A0ABY2E9P1_9MICO|nr:DUF3151 domain-containing protein [Occultella glacieicola]TDE99106.1 DUF3151 domain-containing protein [Occultella glacieicola]